jgi:hypothetical protein
MVIGTPRLMVEAKEIGDVDGHVTENVTVEPDEAPATTLAREPAPLLLQFVTVSVSASALGAETTIAETRAELASKVASSTRSRALVRLPWRWIALVARMNTPFSGTGPSEPAAEFARSLAKPNLSSAES